MKPVLLVTGASRGIGAATALLAARHGWAVAVNYSQNSAAAEAVVKQIKAESGQAVSIQADVGDEAQIKHLFSQVDAQLGRLTGFVNNAGVLDVAVRVDELSWERLQRMMRINVIGAMFCAREAILRMSTKHGGKGGSIVNLSSVAARMGAPGQYVDYAASKGAIDTFNAGLAKEVAAEGIRVNAVRPGIIDTDIHASGGIPDRAKTMAPMIPMLRPGSADEVAQSIVWLLSDAASYVTGANLDVTGGR
ncbi:MAG: SDR family oxidoreductase [Betaproteobacteria bacterium]|jgi:NAD(P)-dependent dehydrogenase (short-subunit alcohol dehydrogenase family)|nr:SDR family oxidoreductase [Betaproteobacteria bacterium]